MHMVWWHFVAIDIGSLVIFHVYSRQTRQRGPNQIAFHLPVLLVAVATFFSHRHPTTGKTRHHLLRLLLFPSCLPSFRCRLRARHPARCRARRVRCRVRHYVRHCVRRCVAVVFAAVLPLCLPSCSPSCLPSSLPSRSPSCSPSCLPSYSPSCLQNAHPLMQTTRPLNGPVWRELAELWREALRHCGSAT